jgi:hypothetical protein
MYVKLFAKSTEITVCENEAKVKCRSTESGRWCCRARILYLYS